MDRLSKVEICNLAISHLGVSKEISSYDEDSSTGRAIRRYYEIALNDTLRSYPWPFAVRFTTMAQVEEDPTDEWGYSYRYPTDCLKILRILSGTRNDTLESKVKYKITSDDSGLLVYTDDDSGEIEYIAYISNTGLYPPDFVMAFSRRLAHLIGARIGASPEKIAEQAAWYRFEISNAEAQSSNEENPDSEPKSSFENART